VDINMASCTEKQFEKWYWAELNAICLECKEGCKQSAKVTLMACPLFVKKEI
jgi:hypothetical protein